MIVSPEMDRHNRRDALSATILFVIVGAAAGFSTIITPTTAYSRPRRAGR